MILKACYYFEGDLDETDYGSAILINELRYDENCGLGLGADYGRAMFV